MMLDVSSLDIFLETTILCLIKRPNQKHNFLLSRTRHPSLKLKISQMNTPDALVDLNSTKEILYICVLSCEAATGNG